MKVCELVDELLKYNQEIDVKVLLLGDFQGRNEAEIGGVAIGRGLGNTRLLMIKAIE